MTPLLLAIMLAAQAAPPPPPTPPSPPPLPGDTPSREVTAGHALFYEDADTAAAAARGRATIHEFGLCVARHSAGMAAETLAMDFRTRAYQSRLRAMADNNRETCFRRRGRMRANNLLFAGALAEGLLARASSPLNARLARAALAPATPSFSPSDAIAVCVVRSVPDDVARLFATEVSSGAEAEALAAIAPIVSACNRTGRPLLASDPGLRAILATAAFRSVRDARARD